MSVSDSFTDTVISKAEATKLKFAKKTLQDYEVISVIGNGSFGTCFKVRDKETGELYAWKGMDYDELSESKKESLISEINVLRQLQHPNIVQYYHHLVNHEAKSIFIVMECCEGGDLAQLISKARTEHKRFEEKYIWRVLFQICRAVQVCHNKIREGTILHRDIKPANIFLDADGNAKLGDFGLARILRRHESFAQTFVGTPCYMSPEIVKGAKYDRKSDVWAVGCLVYEMCALCPPFKGREFEQLSANISHGKYNNIPDLYSKDLQEIIKFMLEVESDQRPSIEIVIRHPIVVRNITDLGNEFPRLVNAEEDFYVVSGKASGFMAKLECSPLRDLSSTMFSEQNSFNEEYGQRRLSLSGIFTPDLRAELFYSARRRIFPKAIIQQSDPEIYESIRREEYASVCGEAINLISDGSSSNNLQRPPLPLPNEVAATSAVVKAETSPSLLTQKVFDQALQERLHAIRAQELLLQQKEQCLNEREQKLNEQDKRLQDLQQVLHEKTLALEAKEKELAKLETAATKQVPPPVPPRKCKPLDSTYCTIDATDAPSIIVQPPSLPLATAPTVAKFNVASLPPPPNRQFATLRKVTFQSPKKFGKCDVENGAKVAILPSNNNNNTNNSQAQQQMRASVSSKSSDDSGHCSSSGTQQRRKSILSIFGLNRISNNSKETSKPTATTAKALPPSPGPAAKAVLRQPLISSVKVKQQQQDVILAKCEPVDLNQIWTKEHKRAAFDLLAAMNAAERENQRQPSLSVSSYGPRHKFRHSVRVSSSSLQRNRLRRSMMTIAPPATMSSVAMVGGCRERIVV